MKLYAKSNVKFVANKGIIVDGEGNIIQPLRSVVDQLNRLETELQRAVWPKPTAAEPVPAFTRHSIFDGTLPVWKAKTPVLDAKAEESLKLFEEVKMVDTVNEMSAMAEEYSSLAGFLTDDSFIGEENTPLVRIDTPILGNPLEMKMEDLVETIAMIHGYYGTNKDGSSSRKPGRKTKED